MTHDRILCYQCQYHQVSPVFVTFRIYFCCTILFNQRFPKICPSCQHCCLVVHTNVPQQQNIFFNWMNRPSDDSSRRIIPVQIWELLHTFKYFFQIKKLKTIFLFYFLFIYFLFCDFSEFLKTLLSNFTMKKRPSDPSENTQVQVIKKIIDSNV